MKKMRMHQAELIRRAEDVVKGTIQDKKTVAHITPGGGKSLAAAAFSKALLDARKVSRVVWICPRTSLVTQAAAGFRDKDFNPNYSAREADNIAPLFRDTAKGQVAYVTTYQSVVAQPALHFRELNKLPYLLILDEPHHLSDDDDSGTGLWVKAIEPIVEGATHTLLMTGTIERHDKKLIPFVDYDDEGDRVFPKKDIFYSRFEALLEEAIVPIDFTYANGWAEYQDADGKHKVESTLATEKEISKVIQTLLSKSEYRDSLLKRGLDQWVLSRKQYPWRAIVICATQDMAESVAKQIQSMYKSAEVALAISREGSESQRVIKRFRNKEYGHILVTVGMAYEGLDVPDCKTLVCLTDTRSIPWLEQAFARVTRVDYKAMGSGIGYDKQRANIFVPDDPKMRAVVSYFEDEQDRGIRVKKEKENLEERESAERGAPGSAFTPLGAGTIGTSIATLDATTIDDSLAESSPVLVAEDEKEIRRKIEMLTRRRDIIKRLPRGSTNKLLFSQFGKPRNKMGISELSKVLNYLTSLTLNGR